MLLGERRGRDHLDLAVAHEGEAEPEELLSIGGAHDFAGVVAGPNPLEPSLGSEEAIDRLIVAATDRALDRVDGQVDQEVEARVRAGGVGEVLERRPGEAWPTRRTSRFVAYPVGDGRLPTPTWRRGARRATR
jgi:hypothetical protein